MREPGWLQFHEALSWISQHVRSESQLKGPIEPSEAERVLTDAAMAGRVTVLSARFDPSAAKPLDDVAPIAPHAFASLKAIAGRDGTLWLVDRITLWEAQKRGYLLPCDEFPGVVHTSVVVSHPDLERVFLSGRSPLEEAVLAADRDEFPYGPPRGMPVSVRRRRVVDRLSKTLGITTVSDRTFQRCGIGKGGARGLSHSRGGPN